MMFDSFQYAILRQFTAGHSVTNKICLQNMYIFLPFFFTLNKKCYKMLYEIIVSTTVKSKEIKTVQMNNKDLMKKLLGIPITQCFYFLSLCCLLNELEIRQYESTKLQKSCNYCPSFCDQITLSSLLKVIKEHVKKSLFLSKY